MNALADQNFVLYFPVFFALLWFGVTLFLEFLSGWYLLMRRFPDRPETPVTSPA